jgi:protein-S-isoprenylcysteine O-methyltransferase Ste14
VGAQEAFLATLAPDDLQPVLRYTNRKGEVWEYALWRMIHHVVNHSTYTAARSRTCCGSLVRSRRRRTSSNSGTKGRRAGECADNEARSVDRRAGALIGSFVFFWIAPAMVAGYVPWLLTRWRVEAPLLGVAAGRPLGYLLVILGAAVVVESFYRFAVKGLGTPAPIAPTTHLVVSGLYRYVRNPMYVGVLAVVLGQALILGRAVLVGYAAFLWAAFFAFVVLYEEPALQGRFGASYTEYSVNVRRWLPRLTPWEGSRPADQL